MVIPNAEIPLKIVEQAAEENLGIHVEALRIDDILLVISDQDPPRIWEILQVRRENREITIVIHEVAKRCGTH